MKRIPSNLAVQTLLYVASPDQKLKILDFDTPYAITDRDYDKSTILFEGCAVELASYHYAKIVGAKVHRWICLSNSTLEIHICTRFEEY